MNSEIIEANKRVHSTLIRRGEYQLSPHRGIESKRRVQSLLSSLNTASDEVRHLDVGCGDGFVFECTPSGWVSQGIDITTEMLEECTKNHPNVLVQEGYAEKLPFPDESFDIVTCYSFLDHLESTENFYLEALRTLKPGGYFYFGLNPSREFYLSLKRIDDFSRSAELNKLDIPLELKKAFDDGTYYEENFNINKDDLQKCEPGKSNANGLLANDEMKKLKSLGASVVSIEYEWIFQQNKIDPSVVNTLRSFLPFTSPCFKYFDIQGVK